MTSLSCRLANKLKTLASLVLILYHSLLGSGTWLWRYRLVFFIVNISIRKATRHETSQFYLVMYFHHSEGEMCAKAKCQMNSHYLFESKRCYPTLIAAYYRIGGCQNRMHDGDSRKCRSCQIFGTHVRMHARRSRSVWLPCRTERLQNVQTWYAQQPQSTSRSTCVLKNKGFGWRVLCLGVDVGIWHPPMR